MADSQDRTDKLISTVNQYDAAMYRLSEEYLKKYSPDDLIKIINDEKEKKGNIRELEKLVNDFIIEYVNELQDLFKNIETEFELGKGKLSNYIKNINLENIRVKLEASKTGDFIKVSSAENQKNNFVFEERQEKISPKIEEKAQSNINIVKNEEKSIPKKKVIKQELSKDKFIIELKKILKEN